MPIDDPGSETEGKGRGKGKGRRRTGSGSGSRSGSRAGSMFRPTGTAIRGFVRLIAPLLFAYELGVLFAGRVNGADIVTRLLYTLAGSRTVYLLLHVMLAVLFLLWIRRANRWSSLRLEVAAPVILEAAIYAMTLGALITLVVDRMLGLGITGNELVAALGAGVHEELVFRLGLFAGARQHLLGRGQRSPGLDPARARRVIRAVRGGAPRGRARRAVHAARDGVPLRSRAARSARSSGFARSRTRSTRT